MCKTDALALHKKSYNTDNTTLNVTQPYVFGVRFWVRSDIILGNNPSLIKSFMKQYEAMCQEFAGFGIYFKFEGVVTGLANLNPGGSVIQVNYDHTEPGYGGFAGTAGLQITLDQDAVNHPSILIHEMGHMFNLRHTFQGTPNNFSGVQTQCNGQMVNLVEADTSGIGTNVSNLHEYVTRDVTDPAYNADVAGDQIVDTYAAFAQPQYCQDPVTGDYTFIFESTNVDALGVPYVNVQVDNYMQYVLTEPEIQILSKFTDGQKVRMYEEAEHGTIWQQSRRDIETLYEIVEGSFYMGGPVQTSNFPRYQRGYTYRFTPCECQSPTDCDQPVEYSMTSGPSTFTIDETGQTTGRYPYMSVIDINGYERIQDNGYSVSIEELDWYYTGVDTEERRCYDNDNRSAVGGRVIRFIDGRPSTNVQITPKSGDEIEDPALIPSLQNGLYAIEKNFNTGETEQKVIQKGNGGN